NAASAFLDRNLAEGRGAKTAIYYEGTAYTYAQIAELANRVGNALLDLGIDLEQRVALLLLDSPQFAAAFFGGIKIGAVPVPINKQPSQEPKKCMTLTGGRKQHQPAWKQLRRAKMIAPSGYIAPAVPVSPKVVFTCSTI